MGDGKIMAASGNEPRRASVTPERWQQVKDLLAQALEVEPAYRPAFLDQTCADDPDLRSEIEALLAANTDAEFLNQPVAYTLREPLAPTRIGRRIGAYQIVEEIGEGGMGEVYRAFRADDQYRKEVAIKLVRAGQDSRLVLARFKNERQVLAGLDHPNIARLLDGGTTEEGVPYFVMELIDGRPINEYCDAHRLPTSERVKLFLQVCSAVQYAHQRLIIHRDLKPGNILVNAEGVPKLLDFGIAKILDPSATSNTSDPTISIFRPLTPGYASPEQVKGETITTASDVYSLGVLLYELLTGHRPYRISSHAAHDIERAVCEFEPERPSMVLWRSETRESSESSAIGTPQSVSAVRDGSPQKLNRNLRGDLDNIIMMALRKEPQRRYASVDQFAADIRRHLEHLPVSASKDTVIYRASKFARRHKAGVIATAAIALTLVIGLAVVIHEARIAQRRFNEVRSLANSLIFDVHDAIQDLPGSTPARKLVVAKALVYLDDLAQNSQGDAALQRELAGAYRRIGEVQGGLYAANLGDPVAAAKSYSRALAIRQSLMASRNGNLDDLIEYAALSRLIDNASLAVKGGQPVATLEGCQRAAQMLEQALPQHPDDPRILSELVRDYGTQAARLSGGFVLSNLGDASSALPLRRRQVELGEKLYSLQPASVDVRHDLAEALGDLGDLLYNLGRDAEAEDNYRRARVVLESLSNGSQTPKVLLALFDDYFRTYSAKMGHGDSEGAAVEAEHGLEIAKKLSVADPENTLSSLLLAAAYEMKAKANAHMKTSASAEPAILKSMSIDAELVAKNPNSLEFPKMQAQRFEAAGEVFMLLRDDDRALHYYRQAAAAFARMQAADPTDAGIRHLLAQSYNGVGATLAESGNPAEAEEFHKKALASLEPEMNASSPNTGALYPGADSYSGLGQDEALSAAGKPSAERAAHLKSAQEYYEHSLKIWSQVKTPRLITPEGYGCTPPAVVQQRLNRVNHALSRADAS